MPAHLVCRSLDEAVISSLALLRAPCHHAQQRAHPLQKIGLATEPSHLISRSQRQWSSLLTSTATRLVSQP